MVKCEILNYKQVTSDIAGKVTQDHREKTTNWMITSRVKKKKEVGGEIKELVKNQSHLLFTLFMVPLKYIITKDNAINLKA